MCQVVKLGVRGYSSVLHEPDRTASQTSPNIRPNSYNNRNRSATAKHSSQYSSNKACRHRTRPPSVVSLIYDQNWSFGNSERRNPLHPVAFALLPITVFPEPLVFHHRLSESTLSLRSISSCGDIELELVDHPSESPDPENRRIWIDPSPNLQDWLVPKPRPKLTITDILFQPPEPRCSTRSPARFGTTSPSKILETVQTSRNMMAEPVPASNYSHNPGPRSQPSVIVQCSEDPDFLTTQLERISLLNNNNNKTNSSWQNPEEFCWTEEVSGRTIRESNDARPSLNSSSSPLTSQGLTTKLAPSSGGPGNTNQNFLLDQLLRVPSEEDLRKRAVYPTLDVRMSESE